MPAEKALAIVVRGTDWSETSRITTLFTREFGKVRALAKGGRRLKSNFEVAFDLLTVCEVVFIRKASGLDLLTEARMHEQFPYLRQNLQALYAGYYVAELLADGMQDYDPHVPLFDAAMQTLRSLGHESGPTPPPPLAPCEGEPPAGSPCDPLLLGKGELEPSRAADVCSVAVAPADSPSLQGGGWGVGRTSSPLPSGRGAGGVGHAATVSAFELVWLHELGYSPRLDACATCGRERLNPTARAYFSPSAGGVLCPECGPAVADRRMVSGEALESLRVLSEGAEAPELAAEVRVEVRQVLGYAVSCVLGRRPRLLSYVDGR